MNSALSYEQLETLLSCLTSADPKCREKIAQLRRSMDEACDQRAITMAQWRSLLDRISLVQARLVSTNPDAWRSPPFRSSDAP